MRLLGAFFMLGFLTCAQAQQPARIFSEADVASIVVQERNQAYALSVQALSACQQGGAALKAENDKLKAELSKLKDAAKPVAPEPDQK